MKQFNICADSTKSELIDHEVIIPSQGSVFLCPDFMNPGRDHDERGKEYV
ncbi:MAG: hypothetical protein WC450_08335 [Candidatus Omnitrophota bacterium]